MPKCIVTDIKWDTDGKPVALITSATVSVPDENCADDWCLEEYISDWLSDEIGFCHFGFTFEKLEN